MMLLIEATPEAYRQKGAFKLPTTNKPSWPYPVVVGGRLYLRDQDNLYVYRPAESVVQLPTTSYELPMSLVVGRWLLVVAITATNHRCTRVGHW